MDWVEMSIQPIPWFTGFRMPILVYRRKDPKTPTIRNLHATINIRTTFLNQKQNDSSNLLCAAFSPGRISSGPYSFFTPVVIAE